jgi:glycosyltransferase WbpL
VSLAAAFAGAWVVTKNASRLGLIDVPNARSSHEHITPRGGGLAIVLGVGAGLLLLDLLEAIHSPQLYILLAGAGAIAVLGAVDDRHPLRARYRLGVQILVAAAVVAALGGAGRLPLPHPLDVSLGWLGGPFTVLWIVTVVNFFNFMDGIDGLAGGQAVASCVGVVVAAWSLGAVQGAGLVVAAAIGFLVWNRPPARIFLGDAGSTSLGFAIAGLPLLAPVGTRPVALFAVAVGLSCFLLDPLETLIRLARQGHRIGTAHRAHSYQLLASTRRRHGAVAGGIVAAGIVLAIAGGLAYRVPAAAWPAAVLGICAYAVERYLAGRLGLRATGAGSELAD